MDGLDVGIHFLQNWLRVAKLCICGCAIIVEGADVLVEQCPGICIIGILYGAVREVVDEIDNFA